MLIVLASRRSEFSLRQSRHEKQKLSMSMFPQRRFNPSSSMCYIQQECRLCVPPLVALICYTTTTTWISIPDCADCWIAHTNLSRLPHANLGRSLHVHPLTELGKHGRWNGAHAGGSVICSLLYVNGSERHVHSYNWWFIINGNGTFNHEFSRVHAPPNFGVKLNFDYELSSPYV